MDWNLINTGALLLLYILVLGFWKPWTKSYADEKGKNFARKEDLDVILAEVRAVTITQKEIESKLSGDLWNQQMHWNQKKDIYADLLNFSQDLAEAYGGMPAILKMRADTRPEYKAEGDKNLSKCLTRMLDSHTHFRRAVMLALIFTNPECVTTLKTFLASSTTGS
jgi:hypothetical protein